MFLGHVVVREVPNRAEAPPIVAFLEDQGIRAIVHSDDCGGVDPALAFIHRAQVLVPSDVAERARALLAEYDSAPLEEGWEDQAEASPVEPLDH